MESNYADLVLEQAARDRVDAVREAGEDWLWLSNQLGVDLRQSGGDLRGFSLCAKPEGWLLTLRVELAGLPQVVFVTRIDATACVRKLRTRWQSGTLTFYPDKYA